MFSDCTLARVYSWSLLVKVTYGSAVLVTIASLYRVFTLTEKQAVHQGMLFIKYTPLLISR